MKKIGIDARLYFQTGVGVYLRNLIHFLQEINPSEIQFYIYIFSKDNDSIHFNNANFVKRLAPYKWHSLSEQLFFSQELNKDNLDLMHFTYFSYPILYQKKFIATVHDLTPLLFKTGRASTESQLLYEIKHNAFKYIFQNQISKAIHIITPTQTIKNQILQKYGLGYDQKVSVEYEGVDNELMNAISDEKLKERFFKPFLLYVGNFYPHKNVERLVRAFSKTTIPVQLVLVGPNDYFSSRIIQLIKDLKQQQRILLYTISSRSEVAYFYKHALALVHPSLSEGFGLPIIESAYFNLPIIASKIDVFKELLGNNFLQFDPNNEQDIAEKIEYFYNQRPKYDYNELLKKCSFKTMADHTLQLYKSLLV